MLFPVERLLEGRDPPLCISQEASIREALSLMVEHDYSQLPVVDREGKLAGLISQETVARRYFHLQGAVSLLDLAVGHCLAEPLTLSPERDILEALDRLKDVYAIVVTRDQRPVGLLTNYDTTNFFRDLTEDLILVEDIEVTLRHYVEAAFPEPHDLVTALKTTFGADRANPEDSAKDFESLTFHEHLQLITARENWPHFEEALAPMELFNQLMAQVRQIRNQLAHFRGRADAIQHDALLHSRRWLESRPPLRRILGPETPRLVIIDSEHPLEGSSQTWYERLQMWLEGRRKEGNSRLSIGFTDIEQLLGQPLPDSARRHRSWWANESVGHVQSRAWLRAGWKVEDADLQKEEVEFRQTNLVLMQVFFADVLESLKKKRPGVTRAERTQPQNWWSMSAGRTGFSIGWVFDGQGRLRVELYVDTGEGSRNKRAFEALLKEKAAIEEEVGEALTWEKLEQRRASRVFSSMPVQITAPRQVLEGARDWAVDRTLRFVDAFPKRISSL